MERKGVKEENVLKKFWKWLWESESWWSYIVFLILVFIIIKFILLPGLGLIFGTSLPLAIVESSSMDHNSLSETSLIGGHDICGREFSEGKFFNIDDYWQTCGKWYEDINITKEQFEKFKFKDGFRKGDIMIILGKKDTHVGDVIIFNAGRTNPIIHRVISQSPLQTKGDHNSEQLPEEKNIDNSEIVGVAWGRIPYLGWVKLFFVETLNKILK